MQIIDCSYNDDISAVIKKCNMNFKRLSFALEQSSNKKIRISDDVTVDSLTTLLGNFRTEVLNVAVPNEVSGQLVNADIPGQVSTAVSNANIPGLVSSEVSSQIGTADTTTVSDFLTASSDIVVVDGKAHRWGRLVTMTFTYRLASSLTVMSDGKIHNLSIGTLTQDWGKASGLINVVLDATYQIVGFINDSNEVLFMSANSRGSSYTIDQNAVLYAGFTYMLA